MYLPTNLVSVTYVIRYSQRGWKLTWESHIKNENGASVRYFWE